MLGEQWADLSRGVRLLPLPKREVRGDVHAIVNQGADHSRDILLSALCFHSSNSLCCFLAGMHANFLASCVLPSMNIIFQVQPACCYHGCSPLQI